jgi:ribonucleoside-diphosphate reductase beta chain
MPNIFEEQIARKPDHYPWTNDFIEAMWHGAWSVSEFNFRSDIQNFKADLLETERQIIIKTLSAIGQIEIAVKKFWARLGDTLPHPSLVDIGIVMSNVEVVHNKAYEKLLDVLELNEVFEDNLKLDIIVGRVKYLKKYLEKNYVDDRKQFIYALILFTLFVENVSLFSQFYIISWFNRYKNVLKDTAQQVQYTSREELVHSQIGIKLIQTIKTEHPKLFDKDLIDKVLHEAKEAFDAESKIIDWIIGDYNEPKLNANVLKEYIKNRINESMTAIGFGQVFDLDKSMVQEYEWMDEEVLGNTMTDFFYKRPVEYSKSNQSFNAEDLF